MATYRQLPERLPPAAPAAEDAVALARSSSAASRRSLFLLSGQVDFLGRMYAFGAMLSFTIAHASVIQLRRKRRAARSSPSARGRTSASAASTGRCSRSSAASAPAVAWLVVVIQDAPTRYVGLGWLAVGFVFYPLYRRRHRRAAARRRCARRCSIGPAIALEYRNILVPIVEGRESEEAVDVACRLAAERRATIVALRVIVVPLELPLDARAAGRGAARRRAARPGARGRRAVRRPRRSAASSARARPAARSSTRRCAASPRSSSSARRAARHRAPRRLRQDRRLRAEERADAASWSRPGSASRDGRYRERHRRDGARDGRRSALALIVARRARGGRPVGARPRRALRRASAPGACTCSRRR